MLVLLLELASPLWIIMHRTLALRCVTSCTHWFSWGVFQGRLGKDGKLLLSFQGVFTQLMLKVTPTAVVGIFHQNPACASEKLLGTSCCRRSSWVTAVVLTDKPHPGAKTKLMGEDTAPVSWWRWTWPQLCKCGVLLRYCKPCFENKTLHEVGNWHRIFKNWEELNAKWL